jgi:hypothetical protein
MTVVCLFVSGTGAEAGLFSEGKIDCRICPILNLVVLLHVDYTVNDCHCEFAKFL